MKFFQPLILAATLASLATADRISYSWCNWCYPPTGPNGSPSCNSAVYSHLGDGDGNSGSNRQTGEIVDGGCTDSKYHKTPRGDARYDANDNCQSAPVGNAIGAMVLNDNPHGYGYVCFKTAGTWTSECGIANYACTRPMEGIGI